MPRHRVVYDPALKATPEWKSLYSRYAINPENKYTDAFSTFQEFYDWSMANGFVIGAKLRRIDHQKPYTKDNIRWVAPLEKRSALWGNENKKVIEKWNETVNRIRVHYGLEPFENKENENDETLL